MTYNPAFKALEALQAREQARGLTEDEAVQVMIKAIIPRVIDSQFQSNWSDLARDAYRSLRQAMKVGE